MSIQIVTEIDQYKRNSRGVDCVEHFVKDMHDIRRQVDPPLRRKIPLKMTVDDHKAHKLALKCYLCGDSMKKDGQKLIKCMTPYSHSAGRLVGQMTAYIGAYNLLWCRRIC